MPFVTNSSTTTAFNTSRGDGSSSSTSSTSSTSSSGLTFCCGSLETSMIVLNVKSKTVKKKKQINKSETTNNQEITSKNHQKTH